MFFSCLQRRDAACMSVVNHVDVAELDAVYFNCGEHLRDGTVHNKRGFLEACEHWQLAY
jgi:hypothetical protein